ncbi:MAG: DNA repair protein RecO [Chitinophagales bacterium]|nr:DNA repair protein RecO [Chitinophagales bacterium]
MLTKTKAIVLKTTKYADASIIAKVYTEQMGLVSLLFQGVRKSRYNKASIIQPSYIITVDIYLKQNKSLFNVKEFSLANLYLHINNDFSKQAILLFACELLNKSVREQEENQALYNYVEQFFIMIDYSDEKLAHLPLLFFYQLAAYLGFEPLNNYSIHQPYFNMVNGEFEKMPNTRHQNLSIEDSLLMHQFLSFVTSNSFSSLSKINRTKLLDIWTNYYKIHLAEFHSLNSIKILQEVL